MRLLGNWHEGSNPSVSARIFKLSGFAGSFFVFLPLDTIIFDAQRQNFEIFGFGSHIFEVQRQNQTFKKDLDLLE